MSKRVSYGLACAGLFASAIMLGGNSAALAAYDCLAGPNRAPAPGGHWYFHLDRTNDRKCWYLVEPDTRGPTAEAPPTQPLPSAEPTPPGFGSFFSLMGLSSAPVGAPPDTGSSAGRTGDSARADDPRNAAAPSPRPAAGHRPDTQAALTPKPRRSPPARPPTEHADEQPASPDQAERDALFQEFLRWRDRRPQ
jgi:hypothetical protein